MPLVERLRQLATEPSLSYRWPDCLVALKEAATEIERLERSYSEGLEAWRVNSRESAERIAGLEMCNASMVSTLRDIASMGRTKGCESARHRLRELGYDVPDYDSMT
jgi:hypothetical protein